MNKIVALFAIALMSLSFAVAKDQFASDVLIPLSDDLNQNSVSIELVAPVDSSFVAPSGSVQVDFTFSYAIQQNDDSLTCSVILTAEDMDDQEFVASLDSSNFKGVAQADVAIGDYKWYVSCENGFGTWNSDAIMFTVSPLETQYVETSIVELVSPNDNQVFETSDSVAVVDFTFSVRFAEIPNKADLQCLVSAVLDDSNVQEIDASLDFDSDSGRSQGVFAVGDYQWQVLCSDGIKSWSTDKRVFSVVSTPIIPSSTGEPANNPATTTQGGSSSSSNDEGSGRRVPLANSPLNPLSNPTSDSGLDTLVNSDDNQPAGITGAVIGALGRKGALGMGIFITLVGVIALAVYNRERLGLVKN